VLYGSVAHHRGNPDGVALGRATGGGGWVASWASPQAQSPGVLSGRSTRRGYECLLAFASLSTATRLYGRLSLSHECAEMALAAWEMLMMDAQEEEDVKS